MSILSADYNKVIDASERVAWRLDDVFPPSTALDFSKPFMPRAMALAHSLPFLSAAEHLKLNHIFGNAYGYLFYFVETYIVDMAMRHAQSELHGDSTHLRAMLRFAEEEVKHQEMFLRFGKMFAHGFPTKCDVVESPQAVAAVILSKSPMAVTLVTLHLELITQAHYVECMRDSGELDPLFRDLFKHHWIEEAQHAKLDVLELTKLSRDASPAQVQQAVDDYFAIAGAFAGLLAQQGKLDVVSLERAIGRTLPETERAAVEKAQTRSYQRAFLHSGVTNSVFLEFLAEHFPAALPGAAQAAEAFA
jgi:P-aminobenzoate N-oxygenase AurF